MASIVVTAYDPLWQTWFETLAAPIAQALAGLSGFEIGHVGSTNVVGLAAKPIIDIDVILDARDGFPAVKAALERAGYLHQGDYGIVGREAFSRPASVTLPCRLYVGARDAIAIQNHLTLQAALRANPAAVQAYAALKLALAAEFPEDIDGYCQGKTEFITGLLAEAGLSAEAVSRIREENLRPA